MAKVDVKEFRGRQVVGFQNDNTLSRLDWLVSEYDVRSVVELGAFVGLSTCWLAERVDRVITVDNFDVRAQDYPSYLRPIHEAAADDQYAEFLRNTLPYPNIVGIRMDFLEAAALPVEADMVYIDGVQSYPAFKAIVEAWLPKAKKVICGDDTQSTVVKRVAKEIGAEPITERVWWKPLT